MKTQVIKHKSSQIFRNSFLYAPQIHKTFKEALLKIRKVKHANIFGGRNFKCQTITILFVPM